MEEKWTVEDGRICLNTDDWGDVYLVKEELQEMLSALEEYQKKESERT